MRHFRLEYILLYLHRISVFTQNLGQTRGYRDGVGKRKVTVKYEVKKIYLVIYLCTIILSWLLFFIRLLNWFVPALQLLPDYILLHVTNFSLSLMVLVALGFAVLIFGGGMKAVTVIGLLIAAFNLGYELVFPILNIPDFADAVAGFLGIAIAYAFLLSLKRNGLMPK